MIEVLEHKKSLEGYNFIDLFAGIGGFHYAFSSFGANCVFASEIDEKASYIYQLNHKIKPYGDITKIDEELIPKHDILCAGFPCQAFSISGKQNGFDDTRGTLFFEIARIVKFHRPKLLFLENVKNFERHDNGNTLKVTIEALKNLDYNVYYKVLNTSNFGLPQNRERIYIIAFNNNHYRELDFNFPIIKQDSKLSDFLEELPKDGKIISRNDIDLYKDYKPTQNLFGETKALNKPLQIGKVNKGGQGERIYHPMGHAITLSAHGGGAGSKTGLYKVGKIIRKLSPRECARLQGFPESFKFHPSISEAQKQFGNSVSINVLQHIITEIIKTINNEQTSKIRFQNSKTGFPKRERYSLQIK